MSVSAAATAAAIAANASAKLTTDQLAALMFVKTQTESASTTAKYAPEPADYQRAAEIVRQSFYAGNPSPVRLQLSRAKGFNLQEHSRAMNGLEAVVVSGRSIYSNPFIAHGDRRCMDPTLAVSIFRKLLQKHSDGWFSQSLPWPKGRIPKRMTTMRDVELLRGKNLACTCALDQPCHADLLLELANAPLCERVK